MAVSVPGSVTGFQKMLDEYGTMKREQLMARSYFETRLRMFCAPSSQRAVLWLQLTADNSAGSTIALRWLDQPPFIFVVPVIFGTPM